MTEKQKRFRVHVVKEIFDTEREYTRSLEFTVTHILEKAREKERNPHESTFTAKNIQTLFCNIEEILTVHQSLVKDLEAIVGSRGPVYETEVASCYLKHKEGFLSYKKYGENNEQAQKLFYELQKQPSFEAFFYGCMLLGGKGEEEISAYFFKPIQRVCKYPLLFRELEKYTPSSHPDYHATQNTLAMMRETCSTINEAKRRVEHLEQIADWQATVEQWEGPNVVDTCNQRIKEGSLIKISAGNTQERQFYLFDNLLVYCKKKGKNGAVFRGRVSVEGLDIEDIQDGTADFHSNGLTVVNGWKVHNLAKDKWFVLLAKTAQEKQEWVEAIRREKDKKKRVAAGIAKATHQIMLTKGERFHAQMLQDRVIKDNRAKLRTHTDSFSGQDMVNWLIKKKEAQNPEEAIILGQALVDSGLMHHVNDKHQFKNTGDLLYRFRYDDKTYKGKLESEEVISRGIRVYCRLHGLFDPLLKDQRVGVSRTNLYCVFSSQRMLDWWCEEKDISNRAEGVALGKELYATGILKHATDPAQNFKDAAEFYRFTADEGHEGGGEKGRKLTLVPTPSRKNFASISDSQCKTFTLLFSPLDHSYGVELGIQEPGPQLGNQRTVIINKASEGAQVCGLRVGQQVLAINGQPINTQNPTEHFGALTVVGEAPPPLYLTVVRRSSEYVVLSPRGGSIGFNVKGSSPVIISSTDKGSIAAKAGIVASSGILKVGDEDLLLGSHDQVVSAVKKALTTSADSKGGAKVELKLSNPFMENMTSYSYETNDNTTIGVYERVIESPYIFSVPAQLFKLYEEEMKDVVSLVEQAEVTDARVTDYLRGLKSMSEVYSKTFVALSGPRWPTYKVYGNPPPVALEACATNLHTSILDVITSGAASSPPISPSSPFEESINTSALGNGLATLKSHTGYCISTMAVPTVDDKSVTSNGNLLKDVEIRRDLLYTLRNHLREMVNEQEAVKRMIQELNPTSGHQMIPNGNRGDADDLTPVHTPTNSPSTTRKRVISVSNPEPMIKLMVQGVLQRVESFLGYLEDKLLLSVVEECDGILKTTAQDELKGYKGRLKSLSEEVKVLAKRSLGEPLNRSTRTLVETVQKTIQELSRRVWISIALCDKTPVVQNIDKLFAQCLTSVITAFGHQLVKAGRGHLNPGVEYEEDSRETSQQWLQMIAKKGVLLHMQSTLVPTNEREFSALRDFKYVLTKVEKVKLFVKPEDKEEPHSLPLHYSELPPVKLEGDRNEVHVTFFIPRSLFKQLPEGIVVNQGIKVIPVLFNRGLQDFQEGLDVYTKEKDLNMASFQKLKSYYQSLRRFRLDKSNLPTDGDEKCLAIHMISRPLNAMDLLMRQIEVAVKEPTRPGVGLLTIGAEVATRMGALRVNICDSGVFRSSLATSLEQVMVLGRCHGLPFRNFRSTLNALRRHGGLIYLAKKNNADQSKSLPKQTPKLYRLPPVAEQLA